MAQYAVHGETLPYYGDTMKGWVKSPNEFHDQVEICTWLFRSQSSTWNINTA